jgi:DNA-binding MarR family transcriptional regulator
MTDITSSSSNDQSSPGEASGRLPWLLRRTNQRYRAAIRDRLVDSGFEGLPQPGYWALMVLADGGSDARQLIGEMGVSKQAVSKLVDALVAGGFVDRRPNGADRRRTDLQLSAKGRQAADAIAAAIRGTEEALVREIGTERFAGLVEILEQLTLRP